ncbi:laccase-4-like isoform X2 [Coccinella septempunctata]|uniref:laccase-4-like isoform X2 n=1 Tax=Coccinella septempunctata TaxID=41139 RepID=UPI001D0624E9|nr:laccase-4-like isoform X2 [Coccinella septempunctata]
MDFQESSKMDFNKANIILLILFIPGIFCVHAPVSKSGLEVRKEYFQYVLIDDYVINHNPCNRKCNKEDPPMICRYHFILEWYDILSKACYNCPHVPSDCFRHDCVPGDGIKRAVLVVNRKLPGPAIHVCHGDQVVVDVENGLASESTTIHWHGQKQRGFPYMDGVPFVTQCPIPPQTTFRYQFIAEDPGTHFWHSHTGMQRGDGVFGAFIVHVPEEEDFHKQLYDYDLEEHVIIIMDWDHVTGMQKFTSHHHNDGDNKPTNLLVNGLGRYAADNTSFLMPTARFKVKKGYRYRFRIINAGFLNCPIQLSIDNHSLNIISSDGYDFKNITGDSIVTYAGERFDFILNADQKEDVYWMRFGGLMDCDERFTSAHQVAVLQYENPSITTDMYPIDEPSYPKSRRDGKQVNPLNQGTESTSSYVSAPEIESLHDWDESLKEIPDFAYYISYDFYRKDNIHFHKAPYYGFSNITKNDMLLLTPQLNHISMKFLPLSLLTQRNEIKEESLCNETTVRDMNCRNDYCECPHIINIGLNDVVELIIIDKGFAYDANHPFHLHGHAFRVVAMEKLGPNTTAEEVYRLDKAGKIKRNLKNPPWKDTVTVPDGGYTILRFHATNPGYWLFHCHIEFHAELGMAVVFKVGDHSDMVSIPRNFPKCGNYFNAEEEISETPCANVGPIQNIFGMKCITSSSNCFQQNILLFSFFLVLLLCNNVLIPTLIN